MSYCVNCGVKLEEGTSFCPLCRIESKNPLEKSVEPRLLYPKTPLGQSEKPKGRASLLCIISLFLCIPVLITTLSDLLSDGVWSWSAYVLASMALFYVIAVLPFFLPKNNPLLHLGIDTAATALFLLALNLIGGWHWFFPFGLTMVLGIGALTFALALMLRYGRLTKTAKTAAVFLYFGLCSVHTELAIYFCFENLPLLGWSLYATLACLVFAIIAVIIDNSPALKEELKKRSFF